MDKSIIRAVEAGWKRWFKEEKHLSQVYYISHDDRIACVEGSDRFVLAEIFKTTGEYRLRSPFRGTYVNKRLAARLAAWAGWASDSVEYKSLIDASLGEATVEIAWWDSAEEAYREASTRGGYAAGIEDGFRFINHSCLGGNNVEIYDCCSKYYGTVAFLEPGNSALIGRGNVWKLPDGEGLAVEALYGVPQRLARNAAAAMRKEGIMPLDEYFDNGGRPFSAGASFGGCGVSGGYTDHLSAQDGDSAMVYSFRDRHYEGGGETTFYDWGCDDDDDNYCEYCEERVDIEDAYSVEDNYYCCPSCAESDGYYRCERCDDWYFGEGGIGSSNQYCCTSCANQSDEFECRNCGEWFEGDSSIINLYCCDSCAEVERHFRCEACDGWVHVDSMVDGRFCCDVCPEVTGGYTRCECGLWVEDGCEDECPCKDEIEESNSENSDIELERHHECVA